MNFILDKANFTFANYHQPITRTPYPFQEQAFKALDSLKHQYPDGFSSMLVLPTGAGKTYTAAHWIIKNYIDQGVKVLWIAHRSELLRQAAESFFIDTTIDTLPTRSSYLSFVVSSEFGRSVNIKKEDLVIASRQSICSGDNIDFYIKWAKGNVLKADRKLLIVLDEAHHAAAKSYRTIISKMKKYIPHVDILGLTATPFRTSKYEEGSLKNIFSSGNGIAYSIDMNTLISLGILANPNHIEVSTNLDMTKLFSTDEIKHIAKNDLTSLSENSLEKLNRNTERNQLIVDTYLANKDKFGRTIVFAVDVINAIALNAIFQSVGIKSDFVVSSLIVGMNRSASTERNPQVIKAFKDGELDVLINVNIVTEGTDIPNIQTVFLARPTTSKILMTQMIGRGLRGEASGGTKETNIVYFIDEWKGLVDFVSPKELTDGEDRISFNSSERKIMIKHYIELSDICEYAVSGYLHNVTSSTNWNNIIPYGVIKTDYIMPDEHGEENTVSREIVVYDEASDIYKQIIKDIPNIFDGDGSFYEEKYIEEVSSRLFFKYCENGTGKYIGVSSETIFDIIQTYLSTGEMPSIHLFEDRVSLFDIVKDNYTEGMAEDRLESVIEQVWNSNAKVRSWYDKDLYIGMMHVYFNRMKKQTLNSPDFLLPPKEQMDMGTLKKHYPTYYQELRNYLIQNIMRDDEGYYYSAIQDGEEAPYRSKYLHAFEMDHIVPISKGGLTVKENLQMILRKQNIAKSNKT